MFTEKRLQRYAEVLLWGLETARSQRFKKYDTVLIRFHQPALRLAEILYANLLLKGFNPLLQMQPTAFMEKAFYQNATGKQLIFLSPGDRALFEHLNGSIFLYAPESLTHLGGIDATKIAKAVVAKKPLRDILDQREAAGHFSWTLGLFPTSTLADHAGLTLEDYVKEMTKACYLGRRDPVAHWQEIYHKVQNIKQWLNQLPIKRLHIESASVDLTVTPGRQRRWLGVSGHNIPSFEVFISPDWRGTSGRYYADQPSFRSGNLIRGIRLDFKAGQVVQASAELGGDFLQKQLEMDAGARRIGEFSLTDKRFSKISRFMANTLYDENYGGRQGNCHLALGSAYADAYVGNLADLTPQTKRALGFNDSALHWDLVNTEKKRALAHLNGGGRTVIYENGQFCH